MLRFDTARLDDRAEVTPEGWIRDTPVLTRAGVFHYRLPSGAIRRELRPSEWVFEQGHLDSLRGVPLTVDHPPGMATAAAAPATIGTVLSAGQRQDNALRAEIVVYNPKAFGARREISLGYSINRLDETPGRTDSGEEYDAVQVGPYRVNHAAIVARGRAGSTARLRLDADDAVLNEDTLPILDSVPAEPVASASPKPSDTRQEAPLAANLVSLRLDSGLTYDCVPEVAAAFDRLRADADAAAGKARDDLAATTRRADALEAERDALKADVAKHADAVARARTDAVAEVKTRLVLEGEASKHGVETRADMSDRAIREAVVSKLAPSTYRFDGKSDEYVLFAWDHVLADAAQRAANGAAQAAQAAPAPARADAASASPRITSAEAARAAMIRRSA